MRADPLDRPFVFIFSRPEKDRQKKHCVILNLIFFNFLIAGFCSIHQKHIISGEYNNAVIDKKKIRDFVR